MAVQNSGTNNAFPIVIGGSPKIREQEIIAQEATRSVVLAKNTLMCKAAASGKWTPVTSATVSLTTGAAVSLGIYVGEDIAAATLVAGDTTGPILIGDAVIDSSLLVFGTGPTGVLTAQTLATLIGATVIALCIQDLLEFRGIFPAATLAIDGLEN